MNTLFRLKSKEERDAQWERIIWKIVAKKGWPFKEAAQYLAERAIGFWLSRTSADFVKGIVQDRAQDPYLERAAEYHKKSGVDASGAIQLW